jgi:hypothetical protein
MPGVRTGLFMTDPLVDEVLLAAPRRTIPRKADTRAWMTRARVFSHLKEAVLS